MQWDQDVHFQKKNLNNSTPNNDESTQKTHKGKKSNKHLKKPVIIKQQVKSKLQEDDDEQCSQLHQNDIEYEIGPILFKKLVQRQEEKKKQKQKQIWTNKLSKNGGTKRGKQIIEGLQKEIQTYLKSLKEEELYIYRILNFNDYLQTLKKTIPPISLRWSIWKLRFLDIQSYDYALYDKLLVQETVQETQILKDIGRSFPHFEYFQIINNHSYGQDALYRVLKAISIYYDKIGYTQGMNFVVGFLLLVNGGNEVEAFWFFVEMCRHQDFMFMGIFEETFPVLNLVLFIFQKKFSELLPELHEHFSENGMEESLWIWTWFLTLFVYNFPIGIVVRMWDYILSTNIFGIIQISISFLQKTQKDLLQMDLQEICEFFKSIKESEEIFFNKSLNNFIDIEEVIENAKSIDISIEQIQKNTEEYCEQKQISNEVFTNYFKVYGTNQKILQERKEEILKAKCLPQSKIEKIKKCITSNDDQESPNILLIKKKNQSKNIKPPQEVEKNNNNNNNLQNQSNSLHILSNQNFQENIQKEENFNFSQISGEAINTEQSFDPTRRSSRKTQLSNQQQQNINIGNKKKKGHKKSKQRTQIIISNDSEQVDILKDIEENNNDVVENNKIEQKIELPPSPNDVIQFSEEDEDDDEEEEEKKVEQIDEEQNNEFDKNNAQYKRDFYSENSLRAEISNAQNWDNQSKVKGSIFQINDNIEISQIDESFNSNKQNYSYSDREPQESKIQQEEQKELEKIQEEEQFEDINHHNQGNQNNEINNRHHQQNSKYDISRQEYEETKKPSQNYSRNQIQQLNNSSDQIQQEDNNQNEQNNSDIDSQQNRNHIRHPNFILEKYDFINSQIKNNHQVDIKMEENKYVFEVQ